MVAFASVVLVIVMLFLFEFGPVLLLDYFAVYPSVTPVYVSSICPTLGSMYTTCGGWLSQLFLILDCYYRPLDSAEMIVTEPPLDT